jgi:lipid-A-disaccharide synthase
VIVDADRRIFISVAEASADLHAAAFLRAAAETLPGCRFYGLTGPRMRAAGAETLYDFTAHAAMLSGVLSVVGHARRALRLIEQSWRAAPPAAVVLIDSPELHLRLARRARQMGVPVLYYIAPQTWAARAYRNRRIARDVDRLACILPFEEAYFRGVGIAAEFVGHPLFESLRRQNADENTMRVLRAGDGPLIALLPGSRRHVIDTMLPRQLEVIGHLRQAGVTPRVAISCVDREQQPGIDEHLRRAGVAARVVVGDNASLLSAAELVLVTSGTATLEVAYYRKPMIVMYDAGRLLRWPYRLLGRLVLATPHLSLVNILAGARVVPEFMPFVPDVRPVARTTRALLHDARWRALMVRQLHELVQPLVDAQPSRRVCEWLAELLGRTGSGK